MIVIGIVRGGGGPFWGPACRFCSGATLSLGSLRSAASHIRKRRSPLESTWILAARTILMELPGDFYVVPLFWGSTL